MSDYAVVLAARMGSERLPGKALAVYCPDGMTNLEQIARRWLASDRSPQVIIATPDDAANDPIAEVAYKLRLPVSRRDHTLPRNVVNEIDLALATHAPDAKWVARALADNPLVDVGLADWRLDQLIESGADGLAYGLWVDQDWNTHDMHERITYAGTTDVWPRRMWDEIAANSSGSQLEHAGAYFWETKDRHWQVRQLPLPRAEFLSPDFEHEPLRTELDEDRDLEMFRALWAALDPKDPCLDTLTALKYLRSHPEIARINSGVDLKTQSKSRKMPRLKSCQRCHTGLGAIKYVNGKPVGVDTWCPHCGAPWRSH